MIKKYIVDFQANGKNHFTGELVGHKTVLKHFIILHRIFASAVENDVLQVSPMQKLKRPKPRKDEIEKEAQVYTEEEAKYIISCLDQESMMWKALVMFMIDSGCRRGEVVGLMWDAVDLTTGEVKIFRNAQYTSGEGTYITTTKNRKNRVLYLNPTVPGSHERMEAGADEISVSTGISERRVLFHKRKRSGSESSGSHILSCKVR